MVLLAALLFLPPHKGCSQSLIKHWPHHLFSTLQSAPFLWLQHCVSGQKSDLSFAHPMILCECPAYSDFQTGVHSREGGEHLPCFFLFFLLMFCIYLLLANTRYMQKKMYGFNYTLKWPKPSWVLLTGRVPERQILTFSINVCSRLESRICQVPAVMGWAPAQIRIAARSPITGAGRRRCALTEVSVPTAVSAKEQSGCSPEFLVQIGWKEEEDCSKTQHFR